MTILRQKQQQIVLWIAAALLALGLAGAPLMTGTASADCTVACVGTTGDEECEEWVGIEGELAVCISSGS